MLLHFEDDINGINRYINGLIDLHKRYHDRGLVIIAIFTKPEDKAIFEQRYQAYCLKSMTPETIPFHIALDSRVSELIGRTMVVGYNHLTYHIAEDPTNVLINRQGNIAGQLGHRFEDANEVIEALLVASK